MARTLRATFPGTELAQQAAIALSESGLDARLAEGPMPASCLPAANLESDGYNERMIWLGLAGAVAGMLAGIVFATQVRGREMMFLAVVPLCFSYWGLAIGLFTAMASERIIQLKKLSSARSCSMQVQEVSYHIEAGLQNSEELRKAHAIMREFYPLNYTISESLQDAVSPQPAPESKALQLLLSRSA